MFTLYEIIIIKDPGVTVIKDPGVTVKNFL